MVSFLGRWVPKVGSNLFTFVAISGQDANIFCEHPGVQVSVTRPSRASNFGELSESYKEMAFPVRPVRELYVFVVTIFISKSDEKKRVGVTNV